MFWEFGTTSVQPRERKNGFPVPKRHQMKHLAFLILLLESRRSSPSSYNASCWPYGIARGVYPESASQEDSTPELYLIKVAVMAPTTARTVKTRGSQILELQSSTGYSLNRDKFNCSNHHTSSSKARIAAWLLICAVSISIGRPPIRCFNVEPSKNSMTMNARPSSCPIS